MTKITLALSAGLLAIACGSSSPAAVKQAVCDKGTTCGYTAQQVQQCKAQFASEDSKYPASCLGAVASYYECDNKYVTCTGGQIVYDEGSSATACAAQLKAANDCVNSGGTTTGGGGNTGGTRPFSEDMNF